MLDRLGPGDEVVVWKLDRLGRNTRHLIELLDDFKVRGIKFRSLREGIATDPASEVGSDGPSDGHHHFHFRPA